MKQEQNFMLIFRFNPKSEYQPTEQEQNEMNQNWGSFIGNIAIKEKLISTHQLGFVGNVISSDFSIKEGISIASNQTLGGNMIVRANSLEEATEMAKDCPILKIGGTAEIRNILSMNH